MCFPGRRVLLLVEKPQKKSRQRQRKPPMRPRKRWERHLFFLLDVYLWTGRRFRIILIIFIERFICR
jgi:hypothetical protein